MPRRDSARGVDRLKERQDFGGKMAGNYALTTSLQAVHVVQNFSHGMVKIGGNELSLSTSL